MLWHELIEVTKKRLEALAHARGVDAISTVSELASISRQHISMSWLSSVPAEIAEHVTNSVVKYGQGEPLQYITGNAYFWNSEFSVGPGVFIPRPETELLVETFLANQSNPLANPPVRVAELGVGSGNIALSILLEHPVLDYFGYEINECSWPFLKTNASRLLNQRHRLHLENFDFFTAAKSHAPFDWIISNPPYIDEKDMAFLPSNVKREPAIALTGGVNGLHVIGSLISASCKLLVPHGKLLFEIGVNQLPRVSELLHKHAFRILDVVNDYQGIPRIVLATLE